MFGKVFQDLISKLAGYAGTAIAGSGVATGEQSTAIVGGLVALGGVLLNIWTNRQRDKDTQIVATANDSGKTTDQVIRSDVALKTVGNSKKN